MKALAPIGRAWRQVQRNSAEKRRVAAGINEFRSWLAPGLWSLPYLGSARRLSFGRSRVAADERGMAGITGSAAKRAMIYAAVACTPPSLVRVPRGPATTAADGIATELRVTKAGGFVLFEPTAERVIHLRREPLTADYQERRDVLARYLPAPAFRLSADRLVLTETWVTGPFLIDSEPARKEQVARELITRSADLVRNSRFGDSAALMAETLVIIDAATDIAPARKARIDTMRDELVASAHLWPLAASHGDLFGHNIVVNDRAWSMIDFEDAGDLPYFFDALSAIATDRHLAQIASRGGFDEELTALTVAAGLPASAMNAARQMTAVVLIGAARHATRHGGSVDWTLARNWQLSAATD